MGIAAITKTVAKTVEGQAFIGIQRNGKFLPSKIPTNGYRYTESNPTIVSILKVPLFGNWKNIFFLKISRRNDNPTAPKRPPKKYFDTGESVLIMKKKILLNKNVSDRKSFRSKFVAFLTRIK